jgi:hypothetical protein
MLIQCNLIKPKLPNIRPSTMSSYPSSFKRPRSSQRERRVTWGSRTTILFNNLPVKLIEEELSQPTEREIRLASRTEFIDLREVFGNEVFGEEAIVQRRRKKSVCWDDEIKDTIDRNGEVSPSSEQFSPTSLKNEDLPDGFDWTMQNIAFSNAKQRAELPTNTVTTSPDTDFSEKLITFPAHLEGNTKLERDQNFLGYLNHSHINTDSVYSAPQFQPLEINKALNNNIEEGEVLVKHILAQNEPDFHPGCTSITRVVPSFQPCLTSQQTQSFNESRSTTNSISSFYNKCPSQSIQNPTGSHLAPLEQNIPNDGDNGHPGEYRKARSDQNSQVRPSVGPREQSNSSPHNLKFNNDHNHSRSDRTWSANPYSDLSNQKVQEFREGLDLAEKKSRAIEDQNSFDLGRSQEQHGSIDWHRSLELLQTQPTGLANDSSPSDQCQYQQQPYSTYKEHHKVEEAAITRERSNATIQTIVPCLLSASSKFHRRC